MASCTASLDDVSFPNQFHASNTFKCPKRKFGKNERSFRTECTNNINGYIMTYHKTQLFAICV